MATLQVSGYATRIFYEGRGVEVTEHYKNKDGENKTRTYTAWFTSAPDIDMGAYGHFTGTATVKTREWTDKEGNPVISQVTGKQGVSADISMNDSTFTLATANNVADDFDSYIINATPPSDEYTF